MIGNGTGSPDGQIEVAQRWTNQKHGVHCRNGKNPDVNEYGIGICLVGDLDKAPPTPRQIAAARALVAYLGDRYHIPADHIDTHAHLASSPTACPGKHFPSQRSSVESIWSALNLPRNKAVVCLGGRDVQNPREPRVAKERDASRPVHTREPFLSGLSVRPMLARLITGLRGLATRGPSGPPRAGGR